MPTVRRFSPRKRGIITLDELETITTDGPFVGSDFTAADVTAISAILRDAGGVVLDHYHAPVVKRRMAARMRELKLTSALSYIEILRADAEEVQRLSDLLSLHVSTFYRDPTTFAALRQILQERVQDVLPSSPQHWWSAGCAAGEEAYSLALTAASIANPGEEIKILATDVSHEILEKGRCGTFDPSHLSNIPEDELSASFTAVGRAYRIKQKFRSMVRFVRHDLLSEAPYPPSDLIFCRYVLIYFNAAEQERVLCRFAESLPVGGLLVLGRTETLRDQLGLFAPLNVTERIYQRV